MKAFYEATSGDMCGGTVLVLSTAPLPHPSKDKTESGFTIIIK